MAARDVGGRLCKLEDPTCSTEEDMLFEQDGLAVSSVMTGCALMGTEDDMMASAEEELVEKELILDDGASMPVPMHKRIRLGPRRRRRMVFAAAGSTALMTMAVVGAGLLWLRSQFERQPQEPPAQQSPVGDAALSVCVYSESFTCPARMLFNSPELHEVATENLMRVGRGIFGPGDHAFVLASVVEGFRNISKQIENLAPMAAAELDMLHLTQPQKDLVMQSMSLLSNPRVQRVGFSVAQAIRESRYKAREELRNHIEERLLPHRLQIRRLRDELIAAELRDPDGETYEWDLTLNPKNVKVMETVSDEWLLELGDVPQTLSSLVTTDQRRLSPVSSPNGAMSGSVFAIPRADYLEMSLSISAGVFEEAKALLDTLDLCMRIFGRGNILSLGAAPLVTALDSSPEPALSCELNTGKGNKVNFTKAVMCPLKFGAQGIDAMRADLRTDESTSRA